MNEDFRQSCMGMQQHTAEQVQWKVGGEKEGCVGEARTEKKNTSLIHYGLVFCSFPLVA